MNPAAPESTETGKLLASNLGNLGKYAVILRYHHLFRVLTRPPQTGHANRVGSSCSRSDIPPSTTISWPVIKLAFGPHRKAMTSAISSILPMRPSGIADL